ncbi:MAG: endonuclease/exonuclease/phosphatase family protein [Micavibrio aeruginosavorus]|uniref:Endonuclease/exonuclease/phosphatase family protein n=1 Tax=Micavibrio aeruginosavorus TaxID=349221 RepID=A0A2W5C0X7_9BACT|nr:MAG: endonuclease/exonuclease/phosphatase family protein [Micavibrio aeruginosavorus]
MRYRDFFPEIYQPAEILQTFGRPCKNALGERFSVVIWNMYKGRRPNWQEDFKRLIEGKDLVLLQESVINTRFDPMFSETEYHEWVMARSHRNLKTLAATGIKTGSSAASIQSNFYISPDVEPIFKTPKMMLATKYALEGGRGELLVVNIHAINFVSMEKYKRQIVQIVEAASSHNGPVILAGDFNTWNAPRYRFLMETAQALGLQEAGLTRKGRISHLNRHLDHIFYRGLELAGAGVATDIRTSDHYPLTAEFIVPA